MQKSEVNKQTFRSRMSDIIFDILEPPAVQKYSICWVFLTVCHKLYLCICEFVFVYLTVGNISFDVLGPWAFQKYSIIRVLKIFWAW